MKKLKTILLSVLFLLPCVFLFGCGNSDPSIVGIEVSLADPNKTMEDKTLVFTYGDEINLNYDQFTITATYSNSQKAVIDPIVDGSEEVGYFIDYTTSNIPSETPIPVGNYELTFCYSNEITDSIKIIVNKATIDMSAVKWNYSSPLTYNGEAQSVELINLPSTVTAIYYNNTKTNAGSYKASTPSYEFDRDNYDMINNKVGELDWTINKCPIDLKNTSWDYTTPFDYNGEDKVVKLKNIPEPLEIIFEGNRSSSAGTYTAKIKELIYDYNNYEIKNNNIKDLTWKINPSTAKVENLNQLKKALSNDSYNKIEITKTIELAEKLNIDKEIIINNGCKIILDTSNDATLNYETVFFIENNAKITQYVSTKEDFINAFNYASKIILTNDLIPEDLENPNLKFIAKNKSYNIEIDLNGHSFKYNFEFTNKYTIGSYEYESTADMIIRFINSFKNTNINNKYYLGYSNENSNIAIKVDGTNFKIYVPTSIPGSNITLNGTTEIVMDEETPRGSIITNVYYHED